jgi:hypothetical protein
LIGPQLCHASLRHDSPTARPPTRGKAKQLQDDSCPTCVSLAVEPERPGRRQRRGPSRPPSSLPHDPDVVDGEHRGVVAGLPLVRRVRPVHVDEGIFIFRWMG